MRAAVFQDAAIFENAGPERPEETSCGGGGGDGNDDNNGDGHDAKSGIWYVHGKKVASFQVLCKDDDEDDDEDEDAGNKARAKARARARAKARASWGVWLFWQRLWYKAR